MSYRIDKQKNSKIAFKAIMFWKTIIIPILLTLFLFWGYLKCFCLLSDKFSSAQLVCSMGWKTGLILVISYSIVKVSSQLLSLDTIPKRLLVAFFLYCFSFALMAFPYWVVAFLQPIAINVFVHVSFIIIIIEVIFTHNKQAVQL